MVGTPLCNPGDLSPRAKQCLELADVVLAEDTRRARLAAGRWGVTLSRLVSFNDHNEGGKLDQVLDRLRRGENLALITDAGMPAISDPGFLLVRTCREAGLPVSVVPGPSAPLAALAGSGIAPQPFTFLGFLPRKDGEISKTVAPFATVQTTLIFFERKDRLEGSLRVLRERLGPRQVCVARELTKIHEEFLLFRLDAPPDLSSVLGEVTVVIGPPEQKIRSGEETARVILQEEFALGGSAKQIAKRTLPRLTGWTGSEIYSMLLKLGCQP